MMKKRDLQSSLCFFCLGIIFTIGSFSYSIWDRYGPGPGFFPLLFGVIFCLLSLVLFWVSLGKTLRQRKKESEDSDSSEFLNINTIAFYLCSFLLFYFLFDKLGFLLTIFFFMITVLYLLSKITFKLSLSISIAAVLLVYLIFVKLVSVPLPSGVLTIIF